MSNQTSNITTTLLKGYFNQSDVITSSITFRIVYGTTMGILLVTSLIGGIFIIRVMHKYQLVKKKAWQYLLILTISDTGACVFSIPFIIMACINEDLLRIRHVCCMGGVGLMFFSVLSIYSLAAISLHRCRTITKPFKSLGVTGRVDVIAFLIVSLLTASFFGLSPLFGFSRFTYSKGRKWCTFRSSSPKLDFLYMGVLFFLGYVIPLGIIIFSSIKIYITVKKQKEIRMKSRRASAADMNLEHLTMVKTISILIVAFFMLFTPTMVYFILGMSRIPVPLWFSHLVYLILLCQGLVNGAIYCFRHDMFKDELLKLVRRVHKGKSVSFSEGCSRSRTVTLSSLTDGEHPVDWQKNEESPWKTGY